MSAVITPDYPPWRARIQRGKRAVDDVDMLDFLQPDHAPAWRRAEAVVQEIRQQHIVGIDGGLRAKVEPLTRITRMPLRSPM